ncbi:Gfo/Idh/MocA family protein [Glacieibacterium megasporae]|uniref:Gfo/Idh/MocA family protein n=1 Tax=Glacieibacterium megasporae TaxID=2835787 RepID=UPI001C1E864B|nr:Gfo/Idh/MocA family oxidoreductase [Polymorphobacter megasporae]UAJ11026.1 Gfo/Idh/MocA family oxidoreductase [Polymorphobacter megasporae]
MSKYRIGIIGLGKIARDQHLPAISASGAFELAAVSNIGGSTALVGVPAFPGYVEMLEAVSDLDAVSICTPPGPRRSIAAACLAAGKHVLLEKPPAATVAEVGDIARRAAAIGKVAFATYHAQHNAAVKRAANLLEGKTVKSLGVIWKEDLRQWHPGQDWILEAGGFGIFDPGINALSILTRILPEPVFVSAAELFFPANRQAPIAAKLTFSTGLAPDGQLTGDFDWRETGPQTWSIAVETVDGTKLKLTDGGSRLETEGAPPFVGPADEYLDIYREFAERLEDRRSNVDAAPLQLVADAFMIATRTEVAAFDFAGSSQALPAPDRQKPD